MHSVLLHEKFFRPGGDVGVSDARVECHSDGPGALSRAACLSFSRSARTVFVNLAHTPRISARSNGNAPSTFVVINVAFDTHTMARQPSGASVRGLVANPEGDSIRVEASSCKASNQLLAFVSWAHETVQLTRPVRGA